MINFIQKIDNVLQRGFDKILPRNLTLRYILGLAIIGILSLSGHIVIQFSLSKVSRDEKMIRNIEEQINNSENFYREIIYLQTVNNDFVYRDRIDELDSEIYNLIQNHYELMSKLETIPLNLDEEILILIAHVQESFELLEESYKRISNVKFLMQQSTIQLTDPILISFIRSENTYRDLLSNLNTRYEIDSDNAIALFQRIEILLLLMTILTLLIEALYVFRPAVKRVYASIQSRTDFLSRLSHEIRNPMNSILGMAQLLSKTRVNSQQQNYIKILENSSMGLLEMLNNLLDFATLEAGKITVEKIRTDLYSVIDKSVDLLTVKIQEKNLELVIDIDKDVPLKIISDPFKLQQVLVNLLSNAAKFTERGFIAIRVKREKIEERDFICISIQDSGVGIDENKIEQIFEGFMQESTAIRRKYGGTGLGLTIARDILQLMNGKISLKTKKNQGSEFIISIPLLSFEPDSSLSEIFKSQITTQSYLIIDDSDESVKSISKLLQDFGSRVERIRANLSFEDIYKHIQASSFSKILIDSSTFGSQLEGFLNFLLKNKLDSEKICILFRYVQTNYLFDLLGQIGIHQVFPKPIKPMEFINFLSGQGEVYHKEIVSLDEYSDVSIRYKVLVAEDSPDNRMLIQLYLEKAPVELYFADNGLKAVDLFQQHRFDMVLMDIQMPEMDGRTAAALIRKIEKERKLKATPILAFSAHKPEEINYDESSGIFNDFVLKPVTAQLLKSKLLEYLSVPKTTTEIKKNKNEIDLTDLIPSYIERRLEDAQSIEEYLSKGDMNMIARLGHQIKGTAKSYGFEDLGLLANELEKSAIANNFDKVKNISIEMKNRILSYKKNHMF